MSGILGIFKFFFSLYARLPKALLQKVYRFFLIMLIILAEFTLGAHPLYAEDNKWRNNISFEFKAGSEQQIGTLDLLVPVWQQSDSLLFTDMRLVDSSGTGFEGNLGLGFRQIERISDERSDDLVWGTRRSDGWSPRSATGGRYESPPALGCCRG